MMASKLSAVVAAVEAVLEDAVKASSAVAAVVEEVVSVVMASLGDVDVEEAVGVMGSSEVVDGVVVDAATGRLVQRRLFSIESASALRESANWRVAIRRCCRAIYSHVFRKRGVGNGTL